ncbi:MAG: transporter substrate-binding domain-containing protein [Campylobacterales bacterium]|nr:transporter substrate-binding domain-containing protein [Campylobacterales bacterium]NQY53194.1 transporter substrate-binding domain-containing protein [Campylobacteraceae bacterium]
MKNLLKKLLVSIFVMSSLVTAVSADNINLWKTSTLNKILERNELIVGMNPEYMPFNMKDKKGRIIGYDVDMAKNMAKAMGVKLKIVSTSWDGIIAGLLTGKYDMIMSGMTITQERNLKINFSDPYVVVGQTMMVKKSIAHKIKTVKDLDKAEYKIVTKLGTTGEIATRKFFKKAKIVTFEGEADAAIEVMNGRADAMVYDKTYNLLFMADKGAKTLVHYDTPLTYEPFGWAIRKGDPDFLNWLNTYLRQIKSDTIINFHNKLDKKWLKETSWLKRVK